MVKKAMVEIRLVEESAEKSNLELEKEIFRAISKHALIPWMAAVKKVKVTEA